MIAHRRHSPWRTLLIVALAVLAFGLVLEWGGDPAPVILTQAQDDHTVTDQRGFDSLFAAGVGHLRNGAPGEAIRAFGRAHRLRPEVPEVHVNLGYAHLAMGRIDQAQAAFRAALELRPGQVNAYYGLADSLEQAGDLEAALGAMRSYVHLAGDRDPFKRKGQAAIWEWEHAIASTAHAPTPEAKSPPGILERLSLRDTDGQIILPEAFADKTLVLNIWATWCPPCRAELPSLQALSDSLDPAAYAVIGIAVDEDAAFVREYLNDVGIDFPSYLDPSGAMTTALLDVTSYPQTLVIGSDGTLRHRIVGARDWASAEMVGLVMASPGPSARNETGN